MVRFDHEPHSEAPPQPDVGGGVPRCARRLVAANVDAFRLDVHGPLKRGVLAGDDVPSVADNPPVFAHHRVDALCAVGGVDLGNPGERVGHGHFRLPYPFASLSTTSSHTPPLPDKS